MITLAQLRILASKIYPDKFADLPAMLSAWAIEDPERELSALLEKTGIDTEKLALALKEMVGSIEKEDRELLLYSMEKVNSGPVLGKHILSALCHRPKSRISRSLTHAGLELDKLQAGLDKLHSPKAGILASQGIVADVEVNPLLKYGRDLTKMAEEGCFEELCDRPEEIERILDVLLRRQKGNGVLTGPAGVGKTALVELFSCKVANEEVPESLIGTRIYEVNMSKMVAGSKYRGDFEQRLHDAITALLEKQPAIMFIDEMHLIWGAGRAEGIITDAANILKPFLARGKLRMIGATTVEEYQKYIARDQALARRFQEIRIEEGDKKLVFRMVSKQAEALRGHHKIEISAKIVEMAIAFTDRHLPNRHQPDKSVDLLDSSAVYAIRKGKTHVSESDLLHVLEQQTRRPVSSLSGQDRDSLLNLKKDIEKYIIGQERAIEKVTATLLVRRQDLGDLQKNLGTFLFAGDTGVGKTELSKVLARVFFHKEALLQVDLAEYNQPGSINKLIGSPAGYADSDREGILIDWLQHHGSGVILFDEIEKAHPEVHNLLLGLLDTGRICSARGIRMDARQCIIVLTTNAITSKDMDRGGLGFGGQSDEQDPCELLGDHFPKEFIDRLDEVILFNRLGQNEKKQVIKLRLDEATARLTKKQIHLDFNEAKLLDYLLDEMEKSKSGTRGIVRLIESKLMQPISLAMLYSENKDPLRFKLGKEFYEKGKVELA